MYTTIIQTDELKNRPGDKNWLIFDCRFDLSDASKGHKAYTKSHIPGAVYAHLDGHLSSPITPSSGRHPMPDLQKLVEWLASCGLTEQSQVVVYDDSFGAMATRLWWLLKCLGHQSVALLDGGWQAWESREFDVDSRLPKLKGSDFQASFDGSCVVSTAQVLANLNTHEFQLIDVRAHERFIGKSEPIDPVAGHIPAAINIPLTENLGENGFFKTPEKLIQLYAELNAHWSTENQVFMCGSGVTACHSVFALALAGFNLPRIYAGSWSEWIRDPSRPVATEKNKFDE